MSRNFGGVTIKGNDTTSILLSENELRFKKRKIQDPSMHHAIKEIGRQLHWDPSISSRLCLGYGTDWYRTKSPGSRKNFYNYAIPIPGTGTERPAKIDVIVTSEPVRFCR